jgi:putative Holliday junction resolvase
LTVIALDLGTKRVGVAKSDELGLMAHALDYIEYKSEEDFILRLSKLLEEMRPEKIIVGHPKTLDGRVGIAAEKIEKQVDSLRAKLPGGVFELWDERLTSKEAECYLRASGKSRSKQREKVDSLSAQILLQSYLDFKRTQDV